MASKKFKIQLSDDAQTSSRATRRILLNAEVLRSMKLSTGDVVAVTKNIGSSPFAVGIVWPSIEQSGDSVHLSAPHVLTAQLQSGQEAVVVPLSTSKPANGLPSLRQTQDARVIRLKEIVVPGSESPRIVQKQDSKQKQRDWLSLLLRETLVDLKYLTPTQTIQVTYEGVPRRFIVSSVSSGKTSGDPESVDDLVTNFESLQVKPATSLWTASWDSSVTIVGKEESAANLATTKPDVEVLSETSSDSAYTSVGGLSKQISEIRDLLEIPLTRPDLFRYFGLKPPRGILLHGPPGTGKTHLAHAIAQSTKSNVIVTNGPKLSSAYHGETEAKLRDVFKQAREKSPCIVVLDEVDALVPNRDGGGGGGGESEVEKRVVATLLTLLDGMEGEEEGENRVVVIGTTNRPNAIDPALRRPGRFDREIEIGVPDAEARLSILQVLLSKTPHNIPLEDLRAVAGRAHGYVGADLSAVVREAGTVAIKRLLVDPDSASNSPKSRLLTLPDLLISLPTVRPSAMRSLFIDAPRITYNDIGGQPHAIRKLREAVEWPLRHPDAFVRLGVKPPKGVLLYGPPGCSKTILARACACESGVNFLAVKGPELLNKFVGESERAVREIFRKARAASPSIIFFDEIDALATSRMSSDSDVGSSHEGVLTSLLNEMDGVQELVGVTVVAATNRPDAIDPALMRSGRLDRILYVGPPDQEGREEILRIRMRSMKVEDGIDVPKIASLAEGCSGAEMSALCQEAALLTMQQDMNAPCVPQQAFFNAAKSMQRQITPIMLQKFDAWKRQSGLQQI
ncbi:AAA family ATPase [Dendrothele bispora CBS 962.96]|uniref:AAA family ATPase n=1 Tax=Dendrothele bispora (strain CBS 962.96) TaxID=1314807 RepID=A0A4S8LH91_DENBC|nr:AAA family ATPase [Dendrothele bispora CBS 962.96]